MKNEHSMKIATGFDLEPLPDGNVLVEFCGDDGKTVNKQIVTANVVSNMPVVATLTGVVLREGVDTLKEILAKLDERQDKEVSDDR